MEQIRRKGGTGGSNKKVIDNEVIELMEACTLNKTQRRKLWHIITKEESFFDIYRRIIKKKLRARSLRRAKSTKKLSLTDLQRAQRYEVALSRKD